MFAFRNQPLKGLYYTYVVLSIPIRVPFWFATSALPAWRPRRTWSLKRAVMVRMLKLIVDSMYIASPFLLRVDSEAKEKNADRLGFVWVDGVSQEYVVGEVAEMANVNKVSSRRVPGFWYGKREKGAYGYPAAPGEKVLYVLHGGSYTSGSGAPDSSGVPTIVNGILAQCGSTFARAFALDYRNPYPAALLDALAGYRHLTTLGFSAANIVVEGDSAGAHLAVALARYLVQLQPDGKGADASIARPGALLLLSPTADWGGTHDTDAACSMERNRAADFVYPILKSGFTARALTGLLPAHSSATNAYISPASLRLAQPQGLFAGFPPTCIVAGGMEQTLDGMATLRGRIAGDIGEERVRWLLYEDAVHDLLTQPWHEPEFSQALKDIDAWVREVYPP